MGIGSTEDVATWYFQYQQGVNQGLMTYVDSRPQIRDQNTLVSKKYLNIATHKNTFKNNQLSN